MTTRAEFGGLGDVDVACSTHTFPTFSISDLALLRVAMNGSFYTRDKQSTRGKFVSKQCPWCEQQDSVYHRTRECQHTAEDRNQMQPQYRNFIMQQPQCTYLHGWFVETAEDKTFQQTLLSIPDTSGQFEHISNVPDVLHCFTDGSRHSPNQKTLRLVTWSVCVATFADHEFEPLAAGGLPGLLQTVLRGELTAAISACKAALAFNKPFYTFGLTVKWCSTASNNMQRDTAHSHLRSRRIVTCGRTCFLSCKYVAIKTFSRKFSR